MIDQNLINQSIVHASQALQNLAPTDIPNLYKVDNFLSDTLLSKLLDYVNSPTTNWQIATSFIQNSTYNQNKLRYQINWDPDTVVEEVHSVFEAQTALINNVYPQHSLKFTGINLWKDSAGYKIRTHTDNPAIAVALQIYLTQSQDVDMGTEFFNQDISVTIPGIVNGGYLAYNTQPIPHKTTNPVPADITRYSLYAIWAKA